MGRAAKLLGGYRTGLERTHFLSFLPEGLRPPCLTTQRPESELGCREQLWLLSNWVTGLTRAGQEESEKAEAAKERKEYQMFPKRRGERKKQRERVSESK